MKLNDPEGEQLARMRKKIAEIARRTRKTEKYFKKVDHVFMPGKSVKPERN